MNWIAENLAPLMFAGMVLFMLIGYPAAFSLAATGLFFGFLGIEFGLIRPDFLGNLTYQLFGIVSNDLLLAIPFFTFMGAILERCGLAEDLLDSFGQLFGPVRGGLSYAVIFVGAILGAITGTVAASVIAMGVISMTPMLKYGYSVRHTMGVIAASGTITQLIPPSLVLVVLADQMGRSVGDMYAGAIGPSIIQVMLFCGWVLIVSIIWPDDVPALPKEARTLQGWELWKRCMRGMIPSLGLIFLVLGTIFMGLATPTEAGAMGVVGAIATNLGATSTDKKLHLGRWEGSLMFCTFLIMAAIEVSLFIDKPNARVFAAVILAVGLILRGLVVERAQKKAVPAAETAPEAKAAALAPTFAITQSDVSGPPILCAVRGIGRTLDFAIEEAKAWQRALYLLFIREQPVMAPGDRRRKWTDDEEARAIFAYASEKAKGLMILPCYAVSDAPADTIVDIAATVGASNKLRIVSSASVLARTRLINRIARRE